MTKYFAKKTACSNGHLHASKREAKRCDQLHLLQRAGEIQGLTIEPKFEFVINGKPLVHDNGRKVGIKPDFSYFENDNFVVEEVKAASPLARGRDYALRKAVFRALFPHIDYREIT